MTMAVPAIFRQAVLLWTPKLKADFGFDDLGAAAVLGNAGHESAGLKLMQELKPTVAGSRGGLGAFQWTGPRRRAFEAFLKTRDAKPNDLEASYDFLAQELRMSEKSAVGAVKAAASLESKVKAFELHFERAGVKHYDSRIKWAKAALDIITAGVTAPVVPVKRPAAIPTPAVGKAEWEAVQNRLTTLGYKMVGVVDGQPGKRTTAAICAFQDANDMPINGTLDATTRAAIFADDAVPMPIDTARATATAADLKPDSGIIQVADPLKNISVVGAGAVAGVPAVLSGLAPHLDTIRQINEILSGVPVWVWGALAGGVLLGAAYAFQAIIRARVQQHREGKTA